MSDKLLSIKEASAAASVSRRTIYHWLRDGRLSYQRTAGGQVRIVASSLFRHAARTWQDDVAARER